jgi:endonuclease/exonuclease/phosphatase (EEP) superfamily protein YafD
VPYYLPPPGNTGKVGTPLKILQLNVLLTNQQHQKIINLIQKENPDIIGLEEITDNWISALKAIEKNYPYRIIKRSQNDFSAFGLALYSKYPLTDPKIKYYGRFHPSSQSTIPSISALIQVDHQPLRLIVTHPVPPNVFEYRNSQLASMAADRKRYEKNLIILGDLNTSQWSPYFQKLIQQTGLRDSQLGFGVQPSWPNQPLWIRTPIDHILVSPDIRVLSRSIGPEVGSDHFPVLAKVALRTPALKTP